MIKDRLYEPTKTELIYQYCGPDAFVQIINSRTVWFSDLFSMNDFLEMRWGYSIFEKAASKILNEVGTQFIDVIDEQIVGASSNALLLASCFSLDGDVLSQWRAYTDDGRGFAIGFSAAQMVEMPVKPLRVLYDEDAQVAEMIGNLRHTYNYEKSIGFKYDDKFKSHWVQAGLDLCAYKNPAFSEEREVRLVHAAGLVSEGKSKKIMPVAGRAWGERSQPSNVQFRARGEIVVPYVALDYSNGSKAFPIREIVLGPKNENLPSNIEVFLNTLGRVDKFDPVTS
jgi:Protein of unknown function (DUF2971)